MSDPLQENKILVRPDDLWRLAEAAHRWECLHADEGLASVIARALSELLEFANEFGDSKSPVNHELLAVIKRVGGIDEPPKDN